MATNGRIPKSDLAPIPGGELRKDAANAWNAPGGPAENGLRPTGSMSSYRTYDEQVYLYRLYQEGRGNLAAVPGTSNHGYGIAVDLAEPWMRDWIDQHGAKYGFGKTEAPSEWWHINYKGGVNFPPPFETLEKGDRGKRVVSYTKKLAFIHPSQHKAYLHNPRRIVQWYWKYKEPVVKAVERFQRDQDLQVDGKIGPRTAKRIDYVFKWQYKNRKKKK